MIKPIIIIALSLVAGIQLITLSSKKTVSFGSRIGYCEHIEGNSFRVAGGGDVNLGILDVDLEANFKTMHNPDFTSIDRFKKTSDTILTAAGKGGIRHLDISTGATILQDSALDGKEIRHVLNPRDTNIVLISPYDAFFIWKKQFDDFIEIDRYLWDGGANPMQTDLLQRGYSIYIYVGRRGKDRVDTIDYTASPFDASAHASDVIPLPAGCFGASAFFEGGVPDKFYIAADSGNFFEIDEPALTVSKNIKFPNTQYGITILPVLETDLILMTAFGTQPLLWYLDLQFDFFLPLKLGTYNGFCFNPRTKFIALSDNATPFDTTIYEFSNTETSCEDPDCEWCPFSKTICFLCSTKKQQRGECVDSCSSDRQLKLDIKVCFLNKCNGGRIWSYEKKACVECLEYYPNCTECDGLRCAACEEGYELIDGDIGCAVPTEEGEGPKKECPPGVEVCCEIDEINIKGECVPKALIPRGTGADPSSMNSIVSCEIPGCDECSANYQNCTNRVYQEAKVDFQRVGNNTGNSAGYSAPSAEFLGVFAMVLNSNSGAAFLTFSQGLGFISRIRYTGIYFGDLLEAFFKSLIEDEEKFDEFYISQSQYGDKLTELYLSLKVPLTVMIKSYIYIGLSFLGLILKGVYYFKRKSRNIGKTFCFIIHYHKVLKFSLFLTLVLDSFWFQIHTVFNTDMDMIFSSSAVMINFLVSLVTLVLVVCDLGNMLNAVSYCKRLHKWLDFDEVQKQKEIKEKEKEEIKKKEEIKEKEEKKEKISKWSKDIDFNKTCDVIEYSNHAVQKFVLKDLTLYVSPWQKKGFKYYKYYNIFYLFRFIFLQICILGLQRFGSLTIIFCILVDLSLIIWSEYLNSTYSFIKSDFITNARYFIVSVFLVANILLLTRVALNDTSIAMQISLLSFYLTMVLGEYILLIVGLVVNGLDWLRRRKDEKLVQKLKEVKDEGRIVTIDLNERLDVKHYHPKPNPKYYQLLQQVDSEDLQEDKKLNQNNDLNNYKNEKESSLNKISNRSNISNRSGLNAPIKSKRPRNNTNRFKK